MLDGVMDILNTLGLLPAIQFVGVAMAAIFIYRYFTDHS